MHINTYIKLCIDKNISAGNYANKLIVKVIDRTRRLPARMRRGELETLQEKWAHDPRNERC